MPTQTELFIFWLLFAVVFITSLGIWNTYGAQWGVPAIVIVLIVGGLRLNYMYSKE